MLFNSYEFMLMFLPVTVILYYLLNRKKLITAATAWLVLASLFFYCWWDIKYLALIIASIIFNFGVGMSLRKTGAEKAGRGLRKPALVSGIIGNIALLGYYKYTNFFITNLNALTGLDLGMQKIVLPLGISFFTFTQIAYLVDVYNEKAREYDFLRYALFVTFFPHLLAGPIIHHKEMMPQFADLRKRVVNYRNLSLGLYLFFIGLFKKVIIADAMAQVATVGFDTMPSLTLIEAWVASLSYTFQLYFDFSAYTDMALGASWMFNIRLPYNFDSPYQSVNIAEFWRRWHMTLSRFLRDYIYIPLGGNREGDAKTSRNLFLTFLIGGIWHGAGWTFVVWGCMHGVAAVVHRMWMKTGVQVNRVLAWFLTFSFVNIAWVFFRAKTWDDAIKVLSGMFGMSGIKLPRSAGKFGIFQGTSITFGDLFFKSVDRLSLIYLVIAFMITLLAKNSNQKSEAFKPTRLTAAFTVAIALYALLNINKVSEFLYFNF